MTNTIKKLPAILLAVIIAAALAFAVGTTTQQAYAAEEPVDGAYVFVWPQGYEYTALPGETVGVFATTWFENELTPEQEASMSFQWTLGEGAEYATIEPDAADSRNAWLKLGELPEGADTQNVEVKVALLVGGKKVAEDYTYVTIDKEFDRIVVGNVIDEYATIGTTDELNAQVLRYTPETPDGKPLSATFSWDYATKSVSIKSNGKEVKKTKLKGTSPDYSVPYSVTRKGKDSDVFFLTATWKDPLGNKVTEDKSFFYYELPNDLSEFTIDTPFQVEDVAFGEAYEPSVAVKYGEYILAGGEYSLTYYRYDGYNDETGDVIWTEVKPDQLFVNPMGTTDQDGNDISGTAIYRVQATAAADSKFKGSTSEYEGYMYLYEEHTLNGYRASVTTEEGLYEVKPGTVLHPVISVGDTQLKIGEDCEIWYENQNTGDIVEEFPTEAGEYWLHLEGKSPYYGQDDISYFKVGNPNKFSVKAKTLKAKAKKTTTFSAKKAFTTKSNGKVYYYKVKETKADKKITVSEDGKITVKKGLKKGKTYKIKVAAFTMGDATHLSAQTKKPVTVKIKIK